MKSPNPEPFAAIPHRLKADIRAGKLKHIDYLVVGELLEWACDRAECDPTVPQIAIAVVANDRTVQRSLHRLEAAGWIALDRAVPGDLKSNVRSPRKTLLWRIKSADGVTPESPRKAQKPSPGVTPESPMGDTRVTPRVSAKSPGAVTRVTPSEEVVVVKKVEEGNPKKAGTDPEPVSNPPQRQRREAAPGRPPQPPEPKAAEVGSEGSPRENPPPLAGPCPFAATLTEADREFFRAAKGPKAEMLGAFAEAGLDDGQRLILAEMPDETRARTERELSSRDRIIVGDALMRLRPRRPMPPPPDRLSTADLIAMKDVSPDYLPALANRLATEFRDSKSFHGFAAKLQLFAPDDLADAYRQAKNPKARKPGAIFMTALGRIEREGA